MLNIAHNAGYQFDLLAGVIAVNDEQFDRVADKIRVAAGGSLQGATVAVWGLTFKARTDDLRDSPSLAIIDRLLAAGAKVQAFDPTVHSPKAAIPGQVAICADALGAVAGADVLTVLTEWDDFRWIAPGDVAAAMAGSRCHRRAQPARSHRVATRRLHPRRHRTMTHHLIAGGGGFVGSHLVDLFVGRGDEVTIVDNFVTGRRSNLAHLQGNGAVTVVEHDITAPLPKTVTAVRASTLCSILPALRRPTISRRCRWRFWRLARSALATCSIWRWHSGARFFLASTSEVYGDPLVHPQPESYWGNVSCTGPRSCYDEAKRFSEALAMAYHRTRGVDVRIARIFNTYGERMRPRDGRVVNTFITQALRGEPLTLHGDGTQTRSFCHVADEVVGLAAVLDGHLTCPVNVGNPTEFTMRQLAELIIEISGSSSSITNVALPDEREGDPLQRCPDISLVRDSYGWQPTISLRAGLTRMIDWFRTKEDLT